MRAGELTVIFMISTVTAFGAELRGPGRKYSLYSFSGERLFKVWLKLSINLSGYESVVVLMAPLSPLEPVKNRVFISELT